MKAIVYEKYRPPEVLRLAEVDRPVIDHVEQGNAKGKVVISVEQQA